MASNDTVIIGVGVGGLVLARGRKHRGIPYRLFEHDGCLSSKSQRYRFRLVHEDLKALERTLSPAMLALLEEPHPTDSPPDLRKINAHTSDTMILMEATGETGKEHKGYPIDGPWFREALSIGIERQLEFGKTFEKYKFVGSSHTKVTFTDKTTASGRILVAADGVHSRVRKMRFPDLNLLDIGRTTMWGKGGIDAGIREIFRSPRYTRKLFCFH